METLGPRRILIIKLTNRLVLTRPSSRHCRREVPCLQAIASLTMHEEHTLATVINMLSCILLLFSIELPCAQMICSMFEYCTQNLVLQCQMTVGLREQKFRNAHDHLALKHSDYKVFVYNSWRSTWKMSKKTHILKCLRMSTWKMKTCFANCTQKPVLQVLHSRTTVGLCAQNCTQNHRSPSASVPDDRQTSGTKYSETTTVIWHCSTRFHVHYWQIYIQTLNTAFDCIVVKLKWATEYC
jgi:hypothetical protein